MKVQVHFELPDEENELVLMLAARRLLTALHDVDQKLRSVQKYDANAEEAIRCCRQMIGEATEDLL